MVIRDSVAIFFDPDDQDDPEIRKIFADDLTRTLWLCTKQDRLIGPDFDEKILDYAEEIVKLKNNKELNAETLFRLLSGFAMPPADGVIGTSEKAFAEELLLYLMGEKKIEYQISGKVSER